MIFILEACPPEDAAATVLLPGWVLCTPVPPQISTHTGTVQKTRNLNCAVGGNVNGTAMLENKMEVP